MLLFTSKIKLSLAAMEALEETFESQPWLDQLTLYYHSLPIFPLFGSVHFILTAFALRKEPGKQCVPQPSCRYNNFFPCVMCREYPVRIQASRGLVCDDVHCSLVRQHPGQCTGGQTSTGVCGQWVECAGWGAQLVRNLMCPQPHAMTCLS